MAAIVDRDIAREDLQLEIEPSLSGLRVLVVEDEALIAMLLEDMFIDLDAQLVGPSVNLAAALVAAQRDNFDVALVDLHLGAQRADAVAAVLADRGIPFAMISGSAGDGTTDSFSLRQTTVLQKPFSFESIAETLGVLDAARAGGSG